MKIKIKQSIAGNADESYGLESFSFAPGQVVEIHDELAAAWLASEVAEPVVESPETAALQVPKTASKPPASKRVKV